MAIADELRKAIAQYEATTGRRISKQALQGLIEGELAGERALGRQNAALELQNRQVALQERRAEEEASAAKTQGAVQLGSTAAYLAGTETGKKAIGGVVKGVKGLFSEEATPAVSNIVEGQLGTLPETAGTAIGSAGEATTAVGAAPAAVEEGAAAAISEGTTPTATGAAGSSTLGLLGTTVGIGLAGYTGAQLLGANEEISYATGGAAAGWYAGGPVGAIVGGVIGLAAETIQDSVVCTELNRQGFIPDKVYVYDSLYRQLFIDDKTFKGYSRVGKPLAKLIRNHKFIAKLFAPFGRAWAYEMASWFDKQIKGNIMGRLMLKLGAPLCRIIGG